MKQPDRFYVRQFLNTEEHGGAAHIVGIVSSNSGHESKRNVDAHFDIADCSRTVSLDFDVYGDSDQAEENVRVKLRRFVKAVKMFEAALLAELDRR